MISESLRVSKDSFERDKVFLKSSVGMMGTQRKVKS